MPCQLPPAVYQAPFVSIELSKRMLRIGLINVNSKKMVRGKFGQRMHVVPRGLVILGTVAERVLSLPPKEGRNPSP